jgi:hypothetical protein
MNKIPLLFEYDDDFNMTNNPNSDCLWVFRGEGYATEKLHGANCRVTVRPCNRQGIIVRVEQRQNPTKGQKKAGMVNPWYVDADDKYILDAATCTDVSLWPEGAHCCEAMGEKIQGNTLALEGRRLFPFDLYHGVPSFLAVPRTHLELGRFLKDFESRVTPGCLAEGIVFQHPDGRRAKIRRKDFCYG